MSQHAKAPWHIDNALGPLDLPGEWVTITDHDETEPEGPEMLDEDEEKPILPRSEDPEEP